MAKYELNKNITFVNPYNFVPLGNKCEKKQVPTDNLLYGKLSCHLVNKTSIAIPDSANVEEKENGHKVYPFFSVNGKKIIPGSELRGVIRNVYETITNSCFGSMQENTMLTARSAKPFAPGLLFYDKNNGWVLKKATRYLVVTEKKFDLYKNKFLDFEEEYKSGSRVNVIISENGYVKMPKTGKPGKPKNVGKYVEKIGEGNVVGYVAIGEKAPRRHFQSIFVPEADNVSCTSLVKEIDKLEKIIKIYRDDSINSQYKSSHKGYEWFEDAKKNAIDGNGAIPVYYQQMGERLYLSPAALGRKIFQRSLNDIVGEFDHQECKSRKSLCPACALFGTTVGDALGSRVRFSDCVVEGTFKQNVMFPELGSPRPSYLPFYADAPKDALANGYDGNTSIRGRKFYWHHQAQTTTIGNKRNASFEILEENGKGNFDIFFDGITMGQLKQLFTAITFNENKENGVLCHKIGHGKPVGYGSTKIVVDNVQYRSFDKDQGTYKVFVDKEFSADESSYICEAEVKNAVLRIVNLNSCNGYDVRYPYVKLGEKISEGKKLKDNVLASHHWFSKNYKLGAKDSNCRLPQTNSSNLQLEIYEAVNIGDNDFDRNDRKNNQSLKTNDTSNSYHRQKPVLSDHVCEHPECNEKTTLDFKGKPYRFCKNHRPNIKR